MSKTLLCLKVKCAKEKRRKVKWPFEMRSKIFKSMLEITKCWSPNFHGIRPQKKIEGLFIRVNGNKNFHPDPTSTSKGKTVSWVFCYVVWIPMSAIIVSNICRGDLPIKQACLSLWFQREKKKYLVWWCLNQIFGQAPTALPPQQQQQQQRLLCRRHTHTYKNGKVKMSGAEKTRPRQSYSS